MSIKKLSKLSVNLDDIKPAEFVNDNYDSEKFKKFLMRFEDSFLWFMISTTENIKGKGKNGIFLGRKLKKLGYYILVNHHQGSNMLVFTNEEYASKEQSHKELNQKFFIYPMSFSDIVECALRMDCDGIIINHSTKPIFLHRKLLIQELENIIKYSHNPHIKSFYKYLKIVK